jgi:hypothetical protein
MTEEEMAAEIAAMRGVDGEDEDRWQKIWSQTSMKAERADNS